MYFYIKALHIIFVITWFSGLFYIVRLFVYSAEANLKPGTERKILLNQLGIMQKRLWYGITWPSAILTLFFGTWIGILYGSLPLWLLVKLIFVLGLFLYHISLHFIFVQQRKEIFKWSSLQLRIWNEAATLFLISIVILAVIKQLPDFFRGVGILVGISALLFLIIKVYKKYRTE